jgi:CheY-like chemotaxis protein
MEPSMTFDAKARPDDEISHGGSARDVLLVEDDELVRYALRRLLAGCHRPCLATSSVEEAQQLLAGHQPALVLTDYNLGGRWTGIDLLLWMRRSARLRGIPTLLMTGDDPEEVRERLAAAGLGDVAVLAKPFEAPELIEVLARFDVGGRHARPASR